MNDVQSSTDQVLLCRCSHSQIVAREAVLSLEARLCSAGCRVVTTPDLCGMAARRDSRLAELLSAAPTGVVACHERAVRWLLDWAEVDPGQVKLASLCDRTAAEVAAELGLTGSRDGGTSVAMLDDGSGWVPWFPVIDYDRCNGCQQCASFCLFGVFEVTAEGRVEVRQPASCKTNCPACARVCPEAAIMFPKLEEKLLSGAEISPEEAARLIARVDLDEELGDDIYAALAERRRRAGRRLLRQKAVDQAIAERQRCACQKEGGLELPVIPVTPSASRGGES